MSQSNDNGVSQDKFEPLKKVSDVPYGPPNNPNGNRPIGEKIDVNKYV